MPQPNKDLTLSTNLWGLWANAVRGDMSEFSEAQAGVGGAQHEPRHLAPFWKKLNPKSECSTAEPRVFTSSGDEAALDCEKYELGNGQKILLNGKKPKPLGYM